MEDTVGERRGRLSVTENSEVQGKVEVMMTKGDEVQLV